MGDTWSGIDESNHHGVLIERGSHGQISFMLALHCSLAVLRDVQERLQKRLTVSPDARKILRDLPADGHLGFVERRLDHDSKLVKNRTQVDAFGHGLRGLA